jgi:hypothetical protein
VPQNLERVLSFGPTIRNDVGRHLQGYFNEFVIGQARQGQAQFTGAAIAWHPIPGKIERDEVLCYFVQDRTSSIISAVGGRMHVEAHPPGHAGTTYLSPGGMISEVYLSELLNDRDPPRYIANMAFHELMHNKIDAMQAGAIIADIHVMTPAGGGAGLASPTLTSDLRLTQRNRDLMRQALFREIPQFTQRL